MTNLIRRHSYIRIEEDEEVWIFEDELPPDEAATQIEAQPEAASCASKTNRVLVFVLTTTFAIATSLVASLIYGVVTN